MLVRLTWARWLRCAGVWVRSVLLIFVLILLTEQVQGSIATRAEATRQLLMASPIKCVLATPDGRTEDVSIMNGLVYSFVQGGWKQYVSQFSIRSETAVKLPDGADTVITGVTLPCLRELRSLGDAPAISYDGGWDEEVFDTQEPVCMVGAALLPYVRVSEDGARTLTLTLNDESRTWRVIGECSERDALWCPFYALYDWTIALNGERLSFILKDNSQLDAWLESAAPYFTPNEDGVYPAFVQLVMHDEAYRNVEQASRRNELLLQIVEPLFTLLVFLSGVLISFLTVRARKQEIAIMQSMGVGRLGLILQGLAETAIPCLIVFPAAWLLGWRVSMTAGLNGMYALGALIPICIYMTRPLIHQLHE
ncbi:MAG: hypothetical protein IJ438_03105 [Clostridia bacterium]|nr:hypothetical protein [Clostridia bacterium]